jgi:Ca2+-binding EF-hand superfamily protein
LFDTDGDGVLSEAEIAALFEAADTNNDGSISISEYANFYVNDLSGAEEDFFSIIITDAGDSLDVDEFTDQINNLIASDPD